MTQVAKYICDQIMKNLPFRHKLLKETQLKNLAIFLKSSFSHISIQQLEAAPEPMLLDMEQFCTGNVSSVLSIDQHLT